MDLNDASLTQAVVIEVHSLCWSIWRHSGVSLVREGGCCEAAKCGGEDGVDEAGPIFGTNHGIGPYMIAIEKRHHVCIWCSI